MCVSNSGGVVEDVPKELSLGICSVQNVFSLAKERIIGEASPKN